MKIVIGLPPNYDVLKQHFAIENADVIYCYGDTIYNPKGIKIADHFVYHESIHCKQQGKDVEGWWQKYIEDPKFRIDQEVEAYGEQVKFIRRKYGFVKAKQALLFFSTSLASKVYGSAVTIDEARNLLTQFTNFIL